jgi:hypothetical protein
MKLILLPFIFRFFFLNIILLVLFTTGCEIINPEEEIPAYMHISPMVVNTNPSVQGTSSHKITDAWVFVDNELIGVYELPATFPVLKKGTKEVLIRPGIFQNGIAGFRMQYPFYTFHKTSLDMKPLKTDTVNPQIRYFDSVKFSLNEDFEDTGIKFEKTAKSDTGIFITKDPTKIFEGTSSGIIFLDNEKTLFEITSIENFVLPKVGAPVFLELNYRTNNSFTVGLFANSHSQVVQLPSQVIINPTAEWNKIYIDLTQLVSSSITAVNFKLFIGGIKDSNVSLPEIIIDNVKLVHF